MSPRLADKQRKMVAEAAGLAGRTLSARFPEFSADEVASTVVKQVLESAERGESGLPTDRSKLFAYVFVSARNFCNRERKRRSRSKLTANSDTAALNAVTDEDAAKSYQERECIRRAFKSLDPEDQMIIALQLFGGASFRDIAEALRTTKSTAQRQHALAMKKLQAAYFGEQSTHRDG